MKIARLIFIIWLLLDACVDPFTIKSSNAGEQLVVDGMITDQPGPYTVKLYTTKSLDTQLDQVNWVKGARVSITDDAGNTENLTEISSGIYQTSESGIQGQVGRTYTLHVTTSQGHAYTSAAEKLLPVGEINNVYYSFKQVEDPTKTDYLDTKNGFEIFVDAEVLPEQEGRVRWRTTGTFEIKTAPEAKTRTEGAKGGGIVIIPDPPACSGWIYDAKNGLRQVGVCTCCECWVTLYSDTPLLSDKTFVVNNAIEKYKLGDVTATRRFFYQKYHLMVEQMSVSQSVYDFWERIATQKQSGSDLFQTPPGATGGNITSESAGALPALGVFAASSIRSVSVVIDRSDVPYVLPDIDAINESCASPAVYKNSTTTKPPFW